MLRWMLVLAIVLVACGGKGAHAGGDDKPDLDADPLALLPASAIVVANVDAHAVYASGAVGAQLVSMTDAVVPLGNDSGFQASRDVDRVVAAGYGSSDVAAVLSGRFDEKKIAQTTKGKHGEPIAKGTYAGWTTYTAGHVVYAVLTAHTLVAGTSDGVRRVLDRIQAGKLARSMPPWVVDTLQTKGAEVAVAADFATQPIASAAIGSVKLPWLEGLKVARIIGNLEQPGVNVAATLTYADPGRAQSAAGGVETAERWMKVLGPLVGGASLQDVKVQVDGADLQCSFAVDDHTLSNLLALAPRFLPLQP